MGNYDNYDFSQDSSNKEFHGTLKQAQSGDARAQKTMAESYYYGREVKADRVRACYWWRKSAEQGDPYGEYNYGYCLFYGYGVAVDKEEAKIYFERAAAQGYAGAKIMLKKYKTRNPTPRTAPKATPKTAARPATPKAAPDSLDGYKTYHSSTPPRRYSVDGSGLGIIGQTNYAYTRCVCCGRTYYKRGDFCDNCLKEYAKR